MKNAGECPRSPDDASRPALLELPRQVPGIAMWLCPLARDARDVDAMAMTLSAHEHARAARFGTDLLCRRWIVGRSTLRSLLGARLGVDAHAVELRRGKRGRPELAVEHGLDFNVSHTRESALIAIACGLPLGSRIGVDIERADRAVDADALARKFMGERERSALAAVDADARRRRFLRLWTCKEAMAKATGDALSAPFRDIEIELFEEPCLVAGPSPYEPRSWRLIDAAVPADFIATLAVWQPV